MHLGTPEKKSHVRLGTTEGCSLQGKPSSRRHRKGRCPRTWPAPLHPECHWCLVDSVEQQQIEESVSEAGNENRKTKYLPMHRSPSLESAGSFCSLMSKWAWVESNCSTRFGQACWKQEHYKSQPVSGCPCQAIKWGGKAYCWRPAFLV